MVHVVHVLYSLAIGGTENGVVNLISKLDSEFRHTVVSMTEAGPLAARLPAGVTIHCLGKQPGLDGRAFVKLTGLLRRLRPDIVHSRNWAAMDAIPAARLARVPIVVHGEHGRDAADPEGQNRRRKRIRQVFSPLVDRFVTVSYNLRRWLLETVRLPEAKIVTIHNGVDTQRFTDQDREAGRRALGVCDGQLVVGTVGRLDPVKDQAGLLNAFAQVRAEVPDTLLILVGEGPCRGELEALATTLGLHPSIRLLGERSDVPLLLKGLDLFVLPSIAEGISNTILEAMATGLPVVATRVGGNPELVEDGITGALIPPRDPETLAKTLIGYLQDPHLRAVQGRAARKRAVDQFDLGRMAEAYQELYISLAREKRLI